MNTIQKKRTQKRSGLAYFDTKSKRWGYRFQFRGVSVSKGGFLSCDEAKAARTARELDLSAGATPKPVKKDLTFREAVHWFLTTHCVTLRRNFYEGRFKLAVEFFNRDRAREIRRNPIFS